MIILAFLFLFISLSIHLKLSIDIFIMYEAFIRCLSVHFCEADPDPALF